MIHNAVSFLRRIFTACGALPANNGGTVVLNAPTGILSDLESARRRLAYQKDLLDRTISDISAVQLREKVAAINEAKNFAHRLLQGIPGAVVSVDLEGKITYMNRAAEQMLRKTRDAAAGHRYTEIFGTAVSDLFSAALENGASTDRTAVRWKEAAFTVSSAPLRDEQDVITGAVAVLQKDERHPDGPGRRPPLNEYLPDLVNHIKNPLGVISGYTQLLPERFGDLSFRRRYISIVNGEIEKLTALSCSLMDLLYDKADGDDRRADDQRMQR